MIQQQKPGVITFYAGIRQACVTYRTGCMAGFARLCYVIIIVPVQTFALCYIRVQKPLVVDGTVSTLIPVAPSANLTTVVAGQTILIGCGRVVLEEAYAEGAANVEEVGSGV